MRQFNTTSYDVWMLTAWELEKRWFLWGMFKRDVAVNETKFAKGRARSDRDFGQTDLHNEGHVRNEFTSSQIRWTLQLPERLS